MRKILLLLTLFLACLLAACGQQPKEDAAPALPAAADPALDDLSQARMALDHYVLNQGDSSLAESNGFKAVNAWLGYTENELNGSLLAGAVAPDHWDPEQPPLVFSLALQIRELGLYRAAAALAHPQADSGPLLAFGSFAQENPELLFPGPSGPLAILGWLAGLDPAAEQLKALNEEQARQYAGLLEIYQQRRADPAAFAQEAGTLLAAAASPQLAAGLRQRLALQIRADLRDAYEKRLAALAETLAGPVLVEIREVAAPGRPPAYASHGVWLLKDGAGAAGLPAFVLDAQGACSMAFTVRQYLLAGAPEIGRAHV